MPGYEGTLDGIVGELHSIRDFRPHVLCKISDSCHSYISVYRMEAKRVRPVPGFKSTISANGVWSRGSDCYDHLRLISLEHLSELSSNCRKIAFGTIMEFCYLKDVRYFCSDSPKRAKITVVDLEGIAHSIARRRLYVSDGFEQIPVEQARRLCDVMLRKG